MKIGFVGAGKVGFTLGKYFQSKGISVVGYFSKNITSAKKASSFTNTSCFESINDLVRNCDALFLTVPDNNIRDVYSSLSKQAIKGKLICHCSGVMSAKEAFDDAEDFGAMICSVHPLFAISDKYKSYCEIADGFFSVEGSALGVKLVTDILKKCGNDFQIIYKSMKHKYHLSATIGSNLVVGLLDFCISTLVDCGFTRENALKALTPIVTNNVKNVMENDVVSSLTGPVERCDTNTVTKHLNCLSGEEKEIYTLLSKRILSISKVKNENRDYSELQVLLEGAENEK